MEPDSRRSLALPLVSGKTSARLLGVCFMLTGILIPVAAHLPRWIEFELVVGTWWVIWLAALTYLLFTGRSIANDVKHAFVGETGVEDAVDNATSDPFAGWWFSGWSLPQFNVPSFDFGSSDSSDDIAGAVIGLVVTVIAIIVGIVLIWLIVEVALPIVAFLAYLLIRGMLARVANCDGVYAGKLGPAFGKALLWASAYTLPLAAAVWLIHRVAIH